MAIPRSPADDLPIPSPAELADEQTIDAGNWHSGEPITLDMPGHDQPLTELWRDRSTGKMWRAVSYAMATRYLVEPVEDPHDRQSIGRREWKDRMARVDDGK